MKRYEYVMYGVPKGKEDWQEEIITTNPKVFNDAKLWAVKEGYTKIRIAKIDLGIVPDFSSKKLLNI